MVMVMRIPTPAHLMNRKISIKRAVDSVDAGNGPKELFISFLTNILANVQFKTGNEAPNLYDASREQRNGTAYVFPGQGIQTNMRLLFDGKEYNITSVYDPIEVRTLAVIDFELVQ